MTDAAKSSFVYVTYIRTTPEELWAALTTPEFMKKYWFGTIDKPGSKLINAVSAGWPKILLSLRSLLETGVVLPSIGELPRG